MIYAPLACLQVLAFCTQPPEPFLQARSVQQRKHLRAVAVTD